MRENFLTDETLAVFKPHIKAIANEYGCTPGYIYKILDSEKNDPFQPFLAWYSACVRAGADVTPYDARLSAVRAKYRHTGQGNVVTCLSAKVIGDANTTARIVQAAKDGKCIEIERQHLDEVETAMNISQPTNIREICRKAVEGRKR